MNETLISLSADVVDAENSMKEARVDLDNAQRWLEKTKVHYAEAIIALDKYKKEHNL